MIKSIAFATALTVAIAGFSIGIFAWIDFCAVYFNKSRFGLGVALSPVMLLTIAALTSAHRAGGRP